MYFLVTVSVVAMLFSYFTGVSYWIAFGIIAIGVLVNGMIALLEDKDHDND